MSLIDNLKNIEGEEKRDNESLHLTANEPFVSQIARHFMNSRLADRYYFGGGDESGVVDFGPGTFRGLPAIQELVTLAEKAAKKMLSAEIVNLSPLSGIHAMMMVILSVTEPGDTVMTLDLAHGGHFATKAIVERTGRRHITTSYDFEEGSFDTAELAKKFISSNAKALYLDASYYINPHNLREIRAALGIRAIIIYDASHTIGLIMGGEFQAPFKEGANVICANTHKTLPGPQKGLIAFRDSEFGEKANNIINGGLFSSPHTSSMIALSVAILEMQKFGKAYARQIITNSNLLGMELENLGYEVRKTKDGSYSKNHQIHLFSDKIGPYRELYQYLSRNNITMTFDHVLGGRMFARIGTQEVTRRGMKGKEMSQIATFIHKSFVGKEFPEEIKEFSAKYTRADYSFDGEMEL
jgi:glycine/serine hydroxymethyltransferase